MSITLIDEYTDEETEALLSSGRKFMEEAPSAPRSNIRDQHIRLGMGFIKNPERLKQNANKTMLYIFLRQSVWKNQHPKDVYNIHFHYYVRQKKLAASWAIETLADLFGRSEKTVRRWRDELVKDGAMEVVKQYMKTDIYVLGEVDEDGNEIYYYDKMDKNVQ